LQVACCFPREKGAKPEQFVDLCFFEAIEKTGLLEELYP
jgi:hypothetical protein